MCHLWILVVIPILVSSLSISAKDQDNQDTTGPTVETKCGKLEGKLLNTPKGQCHAYLGVPFAVPPVGELRWKKPEPAACWTGVKNATSPGPQCIQIGSNATDPTESEDCLYLNIIVPKTATVPSEKLPVMVFIHGGGFVLGSASEYGQEGPCETMASRGVIVVLIQYRLFMYGFLSTGDDIALGNYALWDQVEALRWISKNIESFGGDPKRVTIFGESAGGASVSYLSYTPVAQDLFHQSIAQSGSAFALWANFGDSIASTKKIATGANCTDLQDSKSLVHCLRQLSTAELQNIYNSVDMNNSIGLPPNWSIRVDGELFTQAIFKELNTQKPVVIGANSLEIPANSNLTEARDAFNQTLDTALDENDTKKKEILKEMAHYAYIDSKGDRNDDQLVAQQRAMVESDAFFHAPAANEAVSKSDNGQPVWVYNFDFWSDHSFKADYPFHKGAPHAHELCYQFLLNPPPGVADFLGCPVPEEYMGKYRQVVDYMAEMWTNFAIKGDPSPKDLVWPKFTSVSNASTMVIRSNLSIEPHFYLEAASFWNQLVPAIKGIH